jgi:hypothetical protein
MIDTDKLFIKIISSDQELEEYSYLPLRYNHVYIAEKVSASFAECKPYSIGLGLKTHYYRVYLEGDEGGYHTVHERHIEVIALQEIREHKLKELGI